MGWYRSAERVWGLRGFPVSSRFGLTLLASVFWLLGSVRARASLLQQLSPEIRSYVAKIFVRACMLRSEGFYGNSCKHLEA